jgi:hypothetical protein
MPRAADFEQPSMTLAGQFGPRERFDPNKRPPSGHEWLGHATEDHSDQIPLHEIWQSCEEDSDENITLISVLTVCPKWVSLQNPALVDAWPGIAYASEYELNCFAPPLNCWSSARRDWSA